MYIQPNSTIKFLSNCPLDKTYDHTIYFTSANNQEAYFSSLAKYTLNAQSYQRINNGSMKVEIKADNLYNCNYLMFRNTSFGGKWFYAFVTSVEYVNNIVSLVTFEIDVMQTWFFDYELTENFVDREHSLTDIPGANIVPEQLECGDYVTDDFDSSGHGGINTIVVAATFKKDGSDYVDISGGRYGGVFSGLYYTTFSADASGAASCASWIDGAVSAGKGDGIVAIFQMPNDFVAGLNSGVKTYEVEKTFNTSQMGLNGYAPRNKKLLTYPYNFMYVSNLQGNAAAFPYENFPTARLSGKIKFLLAGDMSTTPSVILAPMGYNGLPVSLPNYDEKIVLSNFPQCSWNTDSFKAWLAQSGGSFAVSSLANAGNSAIGLGRALSTPIGTAGGAVDMAAFQAATGVAGIAAGAAVLGAVTEVLQHSIMPNQAHGSTGSITMGAVGLMDFCFMHKHIKAEFAAIIDDYFDMYGYATHRVKVPNRAVRAHWTYTKTIGCKIKGSCPADDEAKICSIYDKGITFWRNGNEVGNYSLDNSVG